MFCPLRAIGHAQCLGFEPERTLIGGGAFPLGYNTRMIHADKHIQRANAPRNGAGRITARVSVVVILIIACVLIVLGVLGGAPHDVWQRAAMVCYECIGIG